MNLQEQMFAEVKVWMGSGITKTDFLNGKQYSEAKLNYWIAKWKACQSVADQPGFREVGFSEVKLGKVFMNNQLTRIKVLHWNMDGLALFHKRLDGGLSNDHTSIDDVHFSYSDNIIFGHNK